MESLWKGRGFLQAAGRSVDLPQTHSRVFAEIVCGPPSPSGKEYLFFLNAHSHCIEKAVLFLCIF